MFFQVSHYGFREITQAKLSTLSYAGYLYPVYKVEWTVARVFFRRVSPMDTYLRQG